MIFDGPRRLLTLAALLCTALPSFASERVPIQKGCTKPEYPERAQKSREEGISLIGILVRADGTVASSVVLNSSGSRDLDRATVYALSKCLLGPAANSDEAVERWLRVAYTWNFQDKPDMPRAKETAALAASKGSPASRYQLSLLLFNTAPTKAGREDALVVLRSAAELGDAPAQFDLGRRYEIGEEVTADLDEALRWYQKSAAQGDPLSTQRLAMGKLLD